MVFITERDRSSLMMANAGNLPHGRVGPGPVKLQMILAVALAELVGRKLKIAQELEILGREDLALAIEGVTRQPDPFLLAKAQRAGIVELSP